MNAVAIDLMAHVYNFKRLMGDLNNKYDYKYIIDYFNICKEKDKAKNIIDLFYEFFPIFKDYYLKDFSDTYLEVEKPDGSITGHFDNNNSSISLFIHNEESRKLLKNVILNEDTTNTDKILAFNKITCKLHLHDKFYCERVVHQFNAVIFETVYVLEKAKIHYEIIPVSETQIILFLKNKYNTDENGGEICNHVDLGTIY